MQVISSSMFYYLLFYKSLELLCHGKFLSWQFQPVVPTQQGQTCVPSASQQFQPMVQGSLSNVAMPANLSQPRVPPVTNHVPGLPNDISAAFATPVLQTGQQPSVIPSTDSVSVFLLLHFISF